MKNSLWKNALISAVTLSILTVFVLVVRICFKTFRLVGEKDFVAAAAMFASKHPRIESLVGDNKDALKYLEENPKCCRLLARRDPFQATGILNKFLLATRVVEVRMHSAELDQDYTLFVWVNRCLEIVNFSGINSREL